VSETGITSDRRPGLPVVATPLVMAGVGAAVVLGFIVPTVVGDTTPLQAYWLVLPALIAGIRFGVGGALATSVLCWLVTSPFVAQIANEPRRSYGAWLGEAAFLAVVSVTVAALVARLKRADRQMFSLVTQQREQALKAARVKGVLSLELEKRASQDALTGLANRSAFLNQLQEELRVHPDSTAVLFLDLDDFKRVNDTLGHAVGDELIVAVGQRLTRGSRDHDMVARLGGDEFAVLLSKVSAEEALYPAQRFLAELKAPFNLCGRTVVVRASGGLAVSEGITNVGVEQRALDLLKHADLAMYASKVQRSGAVTLFHEEMQREMLERLAMESDMHLALADEQFFMAYQPVVDTREGTVRAVEALLRWDHPDRGLIAPQDFIPVAEQTGLIVPITLWVVRHAATQLKTWDEDPQTFGLAVALNISGRLVVEPGIGAAIARELHHVGIDPSRIIFEITESLLMEDRSVAVQTLCQLRALGTRLSVDDFGTGYSSLSRLNTLPIDEVKIDRSFIERLNTEAGRTIVRASIAMAHGLGLRVVAEGVETERQLHALRESGCDDVQGYLFSRPIAPENIGETIASAGTRTGGLNGVPRQPAELARVADGVFTH
jgi:diguanylate cyclase (GGDEF)-like protein